MRRARPLAAQCSTDLAILSGVSSSPQRKTPEKYTVWYKVQGNAEYADVAEQSLTVTVSDRPSGGGASGGGGVSGGGGGAAPAPTPDDADVITVKKDAKDNTTSSRVRKPTQL